MSRTTLAARPSCVPREPLNLDRRLLSPGRPGAASGSGRCRPSTARVERCRDPRESCAGSVSGAARPAAQMSLAAGPPREAPRVLESLRDEAARAPAARARCLLRSIPGFPARREPPRLRRLRRGRDATTRPRVSPRPSLRGSASRSPRRSSDRRRPRRLGRARAARRRRRAPAPPASDREGARRPRPGSRGSSEDPPAPASARSPRAL